MPHTPKSPTAAVFANYTDLDMLVRDLRAAGYAHTAELYDRAHLPHLSTMLIPAFDHGPVEVLANQIMPMVVRVTAKAQHQIFLLADDMAQANEADNAGPLAFSGFELILMAASRIYLFCDDANVDAYRSAVDHALEVAGRIVVVVETTPDRSTAWVEYLFALKSRVVPVGYAASQQIRVFHNQSRMN